MRSFGSDTKAEELKKIFTLHLHWLGVIFPRGSGKEYSNPASPEINRKLLLIYRGNITYQWKDYDECRLSCKTLKNSVFLDITPCSLLKVRRRFGGTCCLHPPKRRLTLIGLHGVVSQKIELYITTAARTSILNSCNGFPSLTFNLYCSISTRLLTNAY
jgi:hypothetical protein